MKLNELVPSDANWKLGPQHTDVSGVSLDSRVVRTGDLYAALPGEHAHGAEFVAQALAAGAAAVLTDPAGVSLLGPHLQDLEQRGVPVVECADPRANLGGLSARIYGTDADSPRMFGITGTNGKTTTAYLLEGMLAHLGAQTGLIGTIETRIGDASQASVRTTPEAPELHQLLAQMRAAKVDTCVMEVSSHALIQHRVDGAHFAVAGFTNLTQDHLDFHPSMEDYFQAKASLFTADRADSAVVVIDDTWGQRLATQTQIPVRTVSTHPELRPDYLIRSDSDQFSLHVSAHLVDPAERGEHRPDQDASAVPGPSVSVPAHSPLPGVFNVINTAQALAMLHTSGYSLTRLREVAMGLSVQVPGRMEVISAAQPLALVDYSHTPDSVAKVLEALADRADPLVIVLGAGGDRDRTKREAMGRAAARGADWVVVTDDNPRSEDPASIRDLVVAGARTEIAAGNARAEESSVLNIGDRREAIRRAVELAGGGTVVVTGKGHETDQIYAGSVIPFDDRTVTRAAVCALHAAHGKVHN